MALNNGLEPTSVLRGEENIVSSAHLDSAHIGDIHGAFGTIRQHDGAVRGSWKARLLTLLAIMGPGIIVMVGDNDAGGVATYAQAGQNYGTSLLWVLLLLIPVLIVNQEMVVRLGVVTGVGHARLINERFGRFWGMFSVGDLFLLNFLTIVTEFIGINLALAYFGVSPYISVPAAAVLLIIMTATGSFRNWERIMFLFIAVNLLMIPLVVMSHPSGTLIIRDAFLPHIQGGFTSTAMLLIISIVGTTVAPWQLFFQQSNVIDKRITPRWMRYERADTAIGAVVTVLGAGALMVVTAFTFGGTAFAGHFVDAGTVITGVGHILGPVAGDFFALLLLNASLIGAAALTLSTSYAFGDVFNIKHSLHRSWKDGRSFYTVYILLIVVAAAIVLIPNAPLGLITIAVQALAGVLLPSATVFLLLLCNDRDVLGPWVNRPWLNVVGTVIVGVLVMLSLILAATTLFPTINVQSLTIVLTVVLGLALLGIGLMQKFARAKKPQQVLLEISDPVVDKMNWSMPPLAQLPRPVWSMTTKVAMLTMRAYLVIAVLMLVVKIVQLALGH
jgi:NRAMP (natural resistance-associated macrophage protein)-like metal ion transporter